MALWDRLINSRRNLFAAAVTLLYSGVFCLSAFAVNSSRHETIKGPFPSSSDSYVLEPAGRDEWQQPARVIESMGVKLGDSIADVGAGSGYFTFRLADKVGSEGTVYAADIQEGMLDIIGNKMEANNTGNIVPVKSSESNANLPNASCNMVLMVDTYHQLADQVVYMQNLRKALKPAGEIVIIGSKERTFKWGVPATTVIAEMKQAGFKLSRSYDYLEKQYFLIFKAK